MKQEKFDKMSFASSQMVTMGKFRKLVEKLAHISDDEPCMFTLQLKFPAELGERSATTK